MPCGKNSLNLESVTKLTASGERVRWGTFPPSFWIVTMIMLMLDHPAWEVLKAHVARNLPEYITFMGAVAIAAICMWPEQIPRSAQDWWTWARQTFQTAIPAARAGNHQPIIQHTVTQTESIEVKTPPTKPDH